MAATYDSDNDQENDRIAELHDVLTSAPAPTSDTVGWYDQRVPAPPAAQMNWNTPGDDGTGPPAGGNPYPGTGTADTAALDARDKLIANAQANQAFTQRTGYDPNGAMPGDPRGDTFEARTGYDPNGPLPAQPREPWGGTQFGGRGATPATGAVAAGPDPMAYQIAEKLRTGEHLTPKEIRAYADRDFEEHRLGMGPSAANPYGAPNSQAQLLEGPEQRQKEKEEKEQAKGFQAFADAHPEVKAAYGIDDWADVTPGELAGMSKATALQMQGLDVTGKQLANQTEQLRYDQDAAAGKAPAWTPTAGQVTLPGGAVVPFAMENRGQAHFFPNETGAPGLTKAATGAMMRDYAEMASQIGKLEQQAKVVVNPATATDAQIRTQQQLGLALTDLRAKHNALGAKLGAPLRYTDAATLAAGQAATPAAATGTPGAATPAPAKLYTVDAKAGTVGLAAGADPLAAMKQAVADGQVDEAQARELLLQSGKYQVKR